MKLCTESKSFASPANAQRALVTALRRQGLVLDDVRWLISVNDAGRFVPVVIYSAKTNACGLANAGVSVIS